MADFKKFLNDEKTMFIFSFLWGMAIAVVLMRKCMDGYCVVVKGPEEEQIKDKVFKVEGKCYTFDPKISECKKNAVPVRPDVKKDELF